MADSDLDLDLLRDSAREFLGGRGEKDSVADLAAMDWTGLLVDEGRGGVGWRPVETCVIAEELGRAQDRSAWFGCVMAAAALAVAPDELRDRWLPGVLAGSVIAGFARAADVVRIIGGDSCELVITVDRDGVNAIELTADHRRWPDDDAIDVTRPVWCVDLSSATGVPIGSASESDRLSAAARLLVSADAIGALSKALDRLTSYLKERIAFGVPIASFQAVQHRLVELLMIEVRARAALTKAATTLASGVVGDAIAQSAVVHAFVAAKATAAIDECMQLSGGIGFTWEYPLHYELRRTATDSWLFGTARSSRSLYAEVAGW